MEMEVRHAMFTNVIVPSKYRSGNIKLKIKNSFPVFSPKNSTFIIILFPHQKIIAYIIKNVCVIETLKQISILISQSLMCMTKERKKRP